MGAVVAGLWEQCPAYTRLLSVGYPGLSVALTLLSSAVSATWLNALFMPSLEALMHLRVWTLFLGPFFSSIGSGFSFLFILFEIYMIMVHFPAREHELGSSTMLIWTMLMSALVSLVYLVFMFVLYLVYKNSPAGAVYLLMGNHGLWPLIMVLITENCLGDPQGSTSFWGLVNIPNKWYPLCLTAFFCLLNGMQILWPFVAALAVGYASPHMRFERFLPSRVRIARLEERWCGGCRVLGVSWLPADGTAGYQNEMSGRRYAHATEPSSQSLSVRGREMQQMRGGGGGGGNFEAFSGSGNRLGDGGDLAQPLAPLPAEPQASGQVLDQQPAAPGAP